MVSTPLRLGGGRGARRRRDPESRSLRGRRGAGAGRRARRPVRAGAGARAGASGGALAGAALEPAGGHRPAAGRRLVEATNRGRVRRVAGDLRVALGLGEDLLDRVRQRVEALLGLRLSGLEHQRLVDQQREVDGRRVKAEVEQPLGDVQGLHPQLALRRPRPRGRTRACSGGRRRPAGTRPPAPPQARQQVVGVQDRCLRGLREAVAAEAPDVGVGADEHAEVAREPAQPADRFRALVVEVESRSRAVGPPSSRSRGTGRKGSIRSRPRSARHRARRRRAAVRTTCGD